MTTIRGAITIEKNDRQEIVDATKSLLKEILNKNDIKISDIVYILFTATNNIDKAYPAVAAREMGITEASLMCIQEMYVEGSLPMCIRVMVAVNTYLTQGDMVHCYLKNAEILRPDLKKNIYHVAIDGPTASGKSTAAKEVARRLLIGYVDTGAMYRTVALHCIRNNVDLEDAEKVEGELSKFQMTVKYNGNEQFIYLDGEDVSEAIRTQEVAGGSSKVAVISAVREKLTEFQKTLASQQSIVMDGRDIGSVVLPNAIAKFYITASIDERTKRRCIDLEKKGLANNFETVKNQIINRDNNDYGRELAPLCRAEGAYEIDTSELTYTEVADKIVEIVTEKLKDMGW